MADESKVIPLFPNAPIEREKITDDELEKAKVFDGRRPRSLNYKSKGRAS